MGLYPSTVWLEARILNRRRETRSQQLKPLGRRIREHYRVVARIGECRCDLEASRPQRAAPGRADLLAATNSHIHLAQCGKIVSRSYENRHPEEPMLLPAVASGTVEGGVAEAVPAAPDDEQKIIWRRLIT
jgi:hypothetical protein